MAHVVDSGKASSFLFTTPILKIVLCSQSEVKTSILKEVVARFPELAQATLEFRDSQPDNNPVQPINSGYESSVNRIKHLGADLVRDDTLVIAIENELRVCAKSGNVEDVSHVTIQRNKEIVSTPSFGIPIPKEYYEAARAETPKDYANLDKGLSVTAGKMIEKAHPHIKANNWMADPMFGSVDRKIQMGGALESSLQKVIILEKVTFTEDFPKPGVNFRDLSFVLADKARFNYLSHSIKQALEAKGWAKKITKVVGFDARGFIYGSIAAREIGAGFVMIRKKGKLPGKTIEAHYSTEYSKDCMQLVEGVINKDDHVLFVDDVIATGGTFKAGIDILKVAGVEHTVIGCLVVMKVPALVQVATEALAPVEFLSLF